MPGPDPWGTCRGSGEWIPPSLERPLEEVELARSEHSASRRALGRKAVVSIAQAIERWPSCYHGAVVTLVPLLWASGLGVFSQPVQNLVTSI